MPVEERRWPWFHQAVDATVTVLGIVISLTMLVRDSWPIVGVVFALICLGQITSSAALRYLAGRWEQDNK